MVKNFTGHQKSERAYSECPEGSPWTLPIPLSESLHFSERITADGCPPSRLQTGSREPDVCTRIDRLTSRVLPLRRYSPHPTPPGASLGGSSKVEPRRRWDLRVRTLLVLPRRRGITYSESREVLRRFRYFRSRKDRFHRPVSPLHLPPPD